MTAKPTDGLRRLRGMDWAWCALPLGLFLTGSIFGALCGIVAFFYNLRYFASDRDRRLKYMVAGLATITAIIIYLVGGLIVAALLIPQG